MILILFGLLGLLLSTYFFPFLGICVKILNKDKNQINKKLELHPLKTLDILIPVYNQAKNLELTLSSIFVQTSVSKLLAEIRITVFLDGCTDNSLEICEKYKDKFNSLSVLINPRRNGKWNALNQLQKSVKNADWFLLTDVGTVLGENFFDLLVEYSLNPNVRIIAPRYLLETSNLLKKLHWSLERNIKGFEQNVGGPISTHGACIAIEQSAFKKTLKALERNSWINDDLVIPVTLRCVLTRSIILYPKNLFIKDIECEENTNFTIRRNRITYGNIQCFNTLFKFSFKSNRLVTCLLLRRILRTFWAYWLIFIILGMVQLLTSTSYFNILILATSLLLIIKLAEHYKKFDLLAAMKASLIAPYLILKKQDYNQGAWR